MLLSNVIARRYLINIGGKYSKYIIVVGERDKLDGYVSSKFGVGSILSSEDLDGSPVIHSDLTNEVNETNLLNRILYF